MLECVQSAGATVPNDVFCCESSSFQIVQGPKYVNGVPPTTRSAPYLSMFSMSGKSTYLRQIALLAIMAMCGCFIPAEYGSFRWDILLNSRPHTDPRRRVRRIHDNLLTRLSNDDNLEKSLSTFANEMASSAMILGTTRYHGRVQSGS